MWLSVLGALITVGLTFAAIYYTYIKISHPSVIVGRNRRVEDFVQDSYASLIQGEHPPNFQSGKCTCSAGQKFSCSVNEKLCLLTSWKRKQPISLEAKIPSSLTVFKILVIGGRRLHHLVWCVQEHYCPERQNQHWLKQNERGINSFMNL